MAAASDAIVAMIILIRMFPLFLLLGNTRGFSSLRHEASACSGVLGVMGVRIRISLGVKLVGITFAVIVCRSQVGCWVALII